MRSHRAGRQAEHSVSCRASEAGSGVSVLQTRPLTGSNAPVTALAASLARKRMTSAKSAGNIDQRVDRAEMSGGGIDRFFRLCCISQIDAAEFDPLGCCRELRRSMIDAGDSRAPRKGFLGDHLAKRAQRACDDNDFTLHGGLRANENESRPPPRW